MQPCGISETSAGTRVDEPSKVGRAIVAAIAAAPAEKQLGWPERLFVRLNALVPRLVDRVLVPQARVALDCATGLRGEGKE